MKRGCIVQVGKERVRFIDRSNATNLPEVHEFCEIPTVEIAEFLTMTGIEIAVFVHDNTAKAVTA